MDITVRLDLEELAGLGRRAKVEGRSMEDVVRQAVREYLDRARKRDRLDRAVDDALARYADVLERLGE